MTPRPATPNERGASEVISVLLMVAVSIVLAAMVGSVLLNIVGGVDDNPLAGAQVDFDQEDDEIRVVYTATQQKGTTVEVKVLEDDTDLCSQTIGEVGDDALFTSGNCGVSDGGDYTVRVVAESPEGKQAVVLERDGSL